ncbi:MAG: sulfatase [Candidatus Eisenbacteria sp.]|nr:sulfatase [Candidatus Eisenbacteria bacterium]
MLRWWPLPALILLGVVVLLIASPDRHPTPAPGPGTGDERAGENLGTLPPGTPVIFLTIDTLCEDHISRSGYPRETTPFLDSLAAESIYFTRCFSQSSWTLPAMLTLISSLSPPVFGIKDGVVPPPRQDDQPQPARVGAEAMNREIFAAAHVTLAEVFREHGYRTVGISTNGHLIERQGFAQGFDEFNETECMWGTADCALAEALAAIDASSAGAAAPAENLFLWVHLFDPHFDEHGEPPVYKPHPGYQNLFGSNEGRDVTASTIADYDRKIRYTDDQLRLFFAELEERGILDRSLVVIAADHGEEFNEKGRWGHSKAVTNTLINVPLLFRLPGARAGGQVVGDVVRNLDVMPTILDLAGLPAPPGAEGTSLRPALEGRALPSLPVYADTRRAGRDIRCLIDPALDRKVVMDERARQIAFYAFSNDFREDRNLASEQPTEAEGFARRLRAMIKTMQERAIIEQEPAEIPEEELERLRSLGYIGG